MKKSIHHIRLMMASIIRPIMTNQNDPSPLLSMGNLNSTGPIFIGLSGGVDSAVAAYLLKSAGYTVEAVFMHNWEEETGSSVFCTAQADLADAQAICDQLKINLRIVNFANEYWQQVFVHFLEKQRLGETPSPDLLCNKEIKFKLFLEYAKQQGAMAIATGHYARLHATQHHIYLYQGMDTEKDQSYFLSMLNENQLRASFFPIGHLYKTQVRAIAKQLNFQNYAKKSSTGICFIGQRRFKTFLSHYLRQNPGDIETLDGNIIGEHDGLMFYTIGQRKGLQIGGKKNYSECPWYVVCKNLKRNVLIVAQHNQHAALFSQDLVAKQVHWINPLSMPHPICAQPLWAKIRYRQPEQWCTLQPLHSQDYRVHFKHAQRAITPGQAIVFYQNGVCLGSGTIALEES